MNKIRLSKSTIGKEEKAAVLAVLDKEFLGMGEEVNFFEQEIKAYLNTKKEVMCVSTGTSALHLAVEALGLNEDDEILVPSLTYVASYQAISAANVKPVSVEVCEDTLFIDLADAKNRLTSKTKAIMPVHYASNGKDIANVYTFAKENNLRVIEDAAQAFGCENSMGKVGVEGDIICFSFDGIKNITSGEGGAVLSSDETIIQRVKDARLLGVEKDTEKRFEGTRSWDFDVKHQGYRYHMSNIFAAIGRAQLKKIDYIKSKRKEIVQYYVENLNSICEINILNFDYKNIISHIFVIKTKRRNELREYLINKNIECGIHYKPNHLLTKYKSESLPTTEKIYEEILTLPCQLDLTKEEQDIVIKTIKDFFND
ncbi:MAG: aminotransferase [Arcobacter sp.]|nr:MAG: aminotransferase [Arcobacter sp.]